MRVGIAVWHVVIVMFAISVMLTIIVMLAIFMMLTIAMVRLDVTVSTTGVIVIIIDVCSP